MTDIEQEKQDVIDQDKSANNGAEHVGIVKYRKKPVVIEAFVTDVPMDIETPEGTMHASTGDYIITGVNGEQYPCKPDIFEKTYEPADAAPSPVDRDALLVLADEMNRDGKVQRERQKAGEHCFIDGLDVMEYAHRIRKALGVVS